MQHLVDSLNRSHNKSVQGNPHKEVKIKVVEERISRLLVSGAPVRKRGFDHQRSRPQAKLHEFRLSITDRCPRYLQCFACEAAGHLFAETLFEQNK